MTVPKTPGRVSLHGRQLMIGQDNELVSNSIQISRPCVDAAITIGAESTANARAITIQLMDSRGKDIDYVEMVDIYMFTSSAKTAFATTGGSTGLAIGSDGALLAVVAKKYFKATSESDGDIDLTYTDTATSETVCIGVGLPNGTIVTSSAFANG